MDVVNGMHRNLLRIKKLSRPEFDPGKVSFLYHTNPDTYWKFSGFYNHKDFYYGVATKYYPDFNDLCDVKCRMVLQEKNLHIIGMETQQTFLKSIGTKGLKSL